MTGIRQSIVFSQEDTYGQGKGSNKVWIAPPPGTFFTSTHNRNTQRIQTTGSKFWDAQAYGQLSGSWSWTFTMDYEYLEPFFFAFESITDITTSTSILGKTVSPASGGKIFKFEKVNNDRVKSFTVLRKINNQMVGGARNEITQLTGCIVKSIQFQRSAATSKIDVSLSGFYSNERLLASDKVAGIWETDYQEYDNETGGLIEYSCLYAGDLNTGLYMANTESISIGMDNSAAAVYSVCSPFASNYYEGLTSITFSTTCYSTDPLQYKTRLYSGGFTNNPPSATDYTGAQGQTLNTPFAPMSKGMKPVPIMSIACYSNQIDRDDPEYNASDVLPSPNVKDAFASSEKFVGFQLDQVVVKSMPWQKGDGSKLQDSLSSSEARKLTIYVKSFGPKNNSGALGYENWFTSGNTHSVDVGDMDSVTAGDQDQLF